MGSVVVVRGLIPILVAAALAAGLAACGEKDESAATSPAAGGSDTQVDTGGSSGGSNQTQGDDPQSQINNAVMAVIGGDNAREVCNALATDVYVKHSYGDANGCRAAVAKRKPFGVEVTIGKIGNSAATATAKPDGGPNKGETLKVDLVREGEAWKVDLVRSNAPVGP